MTATRGMASSKGERARYAVGPSVLFLGRAGCAHSDAAEACVRDLGWSVLRVDSVKRGETLPAAAQDWRGDYILCFRSFFILKAPVLSAARIAAINFHPGPVEYPGSGCVNFALYDGAEEFGVTAHLMDERVDAGRVLECRRFPILPVDTVATLLRRTHLQLMGLFQDLVVGLAQFGADFLDEKLASSAAEEWRGPARRLAELDRLQVLDAECSRAELERVVRATHTESFPTELDFHGHRFVLKRPLESGAQVRPKRTHAKTNEQI